MTTLTHTFLAAPATVAAWLQESPMTTVVLTIAAVIAGAIGGWYLMGLNRSITQIRETARPVKTHPAIELTVGDITTEKVDVIVNAAKSSLLGGGGVDGAIHRAGGRAILSECRALRAEAYPHGLPTGHAVATTAGDLSADWVIHTVGPVFSPDRDLSAELRSCYSESLAVADALGARSIAFPLISSGVYGWPVQDAIRQALIALTSTPTNVRTARLVLFDEETYRMAYDLASVFTTGDTL